MPQGIIGIWIDASFGWLQLGPVPRQVALQSVKVRTIHVVLKLAMHTRCCTWLTLVSGLMQHDVRAYTTCFVRVCALLSYRDQT